MKIILSRKGFDSSYGGQPSPILPDGTMLSLPIPSENENFKYSELFYNKKTYLEIIKELNEKANITDTCHLDPDIRFEVLDRLPGWKGLFGQANSALGHLTKKDIKLGDIFLFFGWFKEAEIKQNKISYKKEAQDIHAIYGYLQVGKIYKDSTALPDYAKYHSHSNNLSSKNCIYEASEVLSVNSRKKGYGVFSFKRSLILTKKNKPRTCWDLPEYFKNINISYHSQKSFKDNYFKSANRGQEFVIEPNNEVISWLKTLFIA